MEMRSFKGFHREFWWSEYYSRAFETTVGILRKDLGHIPAFDNMPDEKIVHCDICKIPTGDYRLDYVDPEKYDFPTRAEPAGYWSGDHIFHYNRLIY